MNINYDYRISAIRALALLIVVLHILQSNGIRTDIFPFYCGVPLFLNIYVVLLVLNSIWGGITKEGNLSATEDIQGVLALPSFHLGKLGLAHCWYIT